MGYSFRLAVRVLLYALSHRQDNTYHDLCYASRGALAGTRNSTALKWETTSYLKQRTATPPAETSQPTWRGGGGGGGGRDVAGRRRRRKVQGTFHTGDNTDVGPVCSAPSPSMTNSPTGHGQSKHRSHPTTWRTP